MKQQFKLQMILLGICLCSIPSLHFFHKDADRHRFERRQTNEHYFLPEPQVTKVLSTGQPTFVADLLWLNTVLIFADFAWDCNANQAQWLVSMIRSITVLDPKWRTVYFYGGTMMSVCNQIEASDEIFKMGHDNLPEDYFFPFSLAMNAYLEHKDYSEAEKWMRIAASKPDAPSWYTAAVAGMLKNNAQRETSIAYLQEELKKDLSDSVRSMTEERLRLLLHEQYTEDIQKQRQIKEQDLGRSLQSLEELNITQPDPWGEGWTLAPDGIIRSIEMERRESTRSKNAERQLVK